MKSILSIDDFSIQVGPSVAICGILASINTLMIQNYSDYHKPRQVFMVTGSLILTIVVLGFFPFVDGWGNGFGFLFGFMADWVATVNKSKSLTYCKQYLLTAAILLVMATIGFVFIMGFFLFPVEHQHWFDSVDCFLGDEFCASVDPILGVNTSVEKDGFYL